MTVMGNYFLVMSEISVALRPAGLLLGGEWAESGRRGCHVGPDIPAHMETIDIVLRPETTYDRQSQRRRHEGLGT